MKTKIGARIRDLRKENKMKQEKLAEICKVKQSCVSKWERGETLPDAEMIITLCETFKISADYLLGLSDY